MKYEQQLQQLLHQHCDNSASHGIQLHIDSPTLDLSWSGAAGFTDRVDPSTVSSLERKVLTPQHPLRIASNTKTYVAAAILCLWEQQQLDLDASISEYICAEHSQLIKANGYLINAIAPRHLLTHTSGLFDYADSPAFSAAIAANGQHHWTRTEQLQLAMNTGKPYGQPGEVCRYSDTGYILLGEIIELTYGLSLGSALRSLLNYDGLGLSSTWLEKTEPAPKGLSALVHQYDNDLDSYQVDASYDIYGGGGLVSTVGDMACFMRALFTGAVYQSANTLKAMLTSVDAKRGGSAAYGHFSQNPGEYRMGIDGGASGTVFSHTGYLGSYAAFIPSLDMAIGLSINQHDITARAQLIDAILALFEVSRS